MKFWNFFLSLSHCCRDDQYSRTKGEISRNVYGCVRSLINRNLGKGIPTKSNAIISSFTFTASPSSRNDKTVGSARYYKPRALIESLRGVWEWSGWNKRQRNDVSCKSRAWNKRPMIHEKLIGGSLRVGSCLPAQLKS